KLEAGSHSGRLQRTKDGAIDACHGAKTGDAAPPNQCGAILRLELTAIEKEAAPAAPAPAAKAAPDPQTDEQSCPRGMVNGKGKCAPPTAETTHECKTGDFSDCTTQCSKNSAHSCVTLGYMYETGTSAPTDLHRAVELYRKGCDGGNATGCSNLAY